MEEKKLKIGNNWFFALIHFCLIITCIFLPLFIFKSFIEEQFFILQPLLTLIFGIGGFGFYLFLVPNIKIIEQDYIKLIETKNAKNNKR